MIRVLSWILSAVAIGAGLCGVILFAWQSWPVWPHEGSGYISGTNWFYRGQQFGALPMIYGSLAIAIVALLLSVPLGIGAAICTAEYLPRRCRVAVKALIELLAGIPSVVYGLLGILLLRDWIYDAFEKWEVLSGDTLLTAGVLLAGMVLPTIVTLADDAIRAIPGAQRAAARGVGLTRFETICSVTLPQAGRGLGSAVLLGFGRAMGETIAVFLVIGRQDNNLPESLWSLRPLIESGQTLTSKLGGSEINIAYGDSLHWGALMGLGLMLLVITGGVTVLGMLWRRANA